MPFQRPKAKTHPPLTPSPASNAPDHQQPLQRSSSENNTAPKLETVVREDFARTIDLFFQATTAQSASPKAASVAGAPLDGPTMPRCCTKQPALQQHKAPGAQETPEGRQFVFVFDNDFFHLEKPTRELDQTALEDLIAQSKRNIKIIVISPKTLGDLEALYGELEGAVFLAEFGRVIKVGDEILTDNVSFCPLYKHIDFTKIDEAAKKLTATHDHLIPLALSKDCYAISTMLSSPSRQDPKHPQQLAKNWNTLVKPGAQIGYATSEALLLLIKHCHSSPTGQQFAVSHHKYGLTLETQFPLHILKMIITDYLSVDANDCVVEETSTYISHPTKPAIKPRPRRQGLLKIPLISYIDTLPRNAITCVSVQTFL